MTTFDQDLQPYGDWRQRASKGIVSSLFASFAGHLLILLMLWVGNTLWSWIFPPAPLVPTQTMEVSMVVLAKSKTGRTEKAMRAPTTQGVQTPAPSAAAPELPVPQSDLEFQVEKPVPQPGTKPDPTAAPSPTPQVKGDPNAADKRAAELAKLERERLLADLNAAKGEYDQDASDPSSTSDFGINTGGQGDPTDPEYARYILQLQQLFMQHFRPLPSIGQSNPGIKAVVFIEVDPDTGKVVDFRMEKPSGNESYDNAAEMAVQAVQTIPKPPPKYVDLMRSGYKITFTPPNR